MTRPFHIYAIADLHLSLSNKDKDMKIFGPKWENYHEKIEKNWQAIVKPEDLVLIPGDISWAMKLENAMIDLEFIERLNGTKVLIRGNHDYWWPSLKKLEALPFKTLHFIQNNSFIFHNVAICGTRLWDTHEFDFADYIQYKENPKEKKKEPQDDEKIFLSELERLKLSIQTLPKDDKLRIAMLHYPPLGKSLNETSVSKMLEGAHIQYACFGHLHNLKTSILPFGEARGVKYIFCSADEIDFIPQKIL